MASRRTAATCSTLLLLLLQLASHAAGLDNGLARKPPMGWMSWEAFACGVDCSLDPRNCVSAGLFRRQADLLVNEGYAAVGYEYLSMDDCWGAQQRGPEGELRADPARFPGGLKPLGDFLHAKGLRFGTCERHLGSPVCPLAPAPNGSACAAQAAACIV